MVTKRRLSIAFYGHTERLADIERRLDAASARWGDEGDLIDDLILFVNARGAEFDDYVAMAVEAAEQLDSALSALSGVVQTHVADHTRAVAPVIQRWAGDELAKVVRGEKASRLSDARTYKASDSPVPGPITFQRASGPKFRTKLRHAFKSIEAFTEWGLIVAGDPARSYHSLICQCRLDSCRQFFRAAATPGRTRRAFCSNEHMLKSHEQTSHERVAAKRAGMPVAAWRRKQK